MSVLVIGAVATSLAIWMIARKKAPKISVWLAMIGGLTVGFGLFAVWAQRIGVWATAAGNKSTALLFGSAVPAVLAAIVLAELVHAAHPKKGKPHRYIHPVLGFLAPVLLVAAGGVFAEVIGYAHHGVDVIPSSFSNLTTTR
jgi:hypothetical protein